MITQETVQQIQQAPIKERIQIIEVILQSLKQDIKENERTKIQLWKSFKVRSFNLGQEVTLNRNEMYAERSL